MSRGKDEKPLKSWSKSNRDGRALCVVVRRSISLADSPCSSASGRSETIAERRQKRMKPATATTNRPTSRSLDLVFFSESRPAATTGSRIQTEGLISEIAHAKKALAAMRHRPLPAARQNAMTARDPMARSLHAVRSYTTTTGMEESEAQSRNAVFADVLCLT